jgi:hypothetical protein
MDLSEAEQAAYWAHAPALEVDLTRLMAEGFSEPWHSRLAAHRRLAFSARAAGSTTGPIPCATAGAAGRGGPCQGSAAQAGHEEAGYDQGEPRLACPAHLPHIPVHASKRDLHAYSSGVLGEPSWQG